jgi:hypothetical protein
VLFRSDEPASNIEFTGRMELADEYFDRALPHGMRAEIFSVDEFESLDGG